MIPGIIASSAGTLAGPPGSATLAAADFVNGAYSVGAVSQTAADMIDKPELIDVDGLAIDWDVEPYDIAYPLGGFLSALLTSECTIVIEFTSPETGSFNMQLLHMDDSGSSEPSGDQVIIESGQTAVNYNDGRFISRTAPSNPAVRRIAATRTNAYVSVSANGGTVSTDATPATDLVLSAAAIGGMPGDFADFQGHIRSIEVYPPVADEDLPGLSAL